MAATPKLLVPNDGVAISPREEENATLKILVLSPHRDDAAFSVGLAMRVWLRAGHAVEVMNVFTQSTYAPYVDQTQMSNADELQTISEVRRKEDVSILKHLPGLTMKDAGLRDAPLRLPCEINQVCDMTLDPEDEAIVEVRQAILDFAKGGEKVALVAPLALGHHVDHCLAHHAALAANTQVACAFYEDLPYATRPGAREELEERCRQTSVAAGEILQAMTSPSADGTQWKLDLVRLYRSQIDDSMARVIAGHADTSGGSERLWVNARWLASDVFAGWQVNADDKH